MNHSPAFYDVVTGFVCLWYKYNLCRVPVPDVVGKPIVDKTSKAVRAFPEPIPNKRITDVIQAWAGIRRASLYSSFQLDGWFHFDSH